jgi:hypothetical protein
MLETSEPTQVYTLNKIVNKKPLAALISVGGEEKSWPAGLFMKEIESDCKSSSGNGLDRSLTA